MEELVPIGDLDKCQATPQSKCILSNASLLETEAFNKSPLSQNRACLSRTAPAASGKELRWSRCSVSAQSLGDVSQVVLPSVSCRFCPS